MNGVVILGAGLAGLGCSKRLGGAGIYEAASHPGGHTWSHEIGGVHFDEGAHICHSKDRAWVDTLYEAAGDVVAIPESRVSNYWHGHWFTYPVQNHLSELPLDVRTAALADFVAAQIEYRDRTPRNYREWCLFQYGRYLTEQFYELYTRKYWRVPMEDLGTDWLAGRLLPSEVQRIVAGALAEQPEQQSTFARFHYPAQGGFQRFFSAFYDGTEIVLNARAEAVDARRREVAFGNGHTTSYECLASSIPLTDLVGIIKEVPTAIREAASRLRHIQLLCVNMIIDRPDLTPSHWFYVYDQDIDASRVSVVSNLAPGSVPPGRTALQAEVFRLGTEELDVDALTAKTVSDMGRVLGFDPHADVVVVQAVPVRHAYVISDLVRQDAVDVIMSWLHEQRIYPMGMLGKWKFIWSDEAYRSGQETADQIEKLL